MRRDKLFMIRILGKPRRRAISCPPVRHEGNQLELSGAGPASSRAGSSSPETIPQSRWNISDGDESSGGSHG